MARASSHAQLIGIALAVAATALIAAGPAQAVPKVNGVYDLDPSEMPLYLTEGPDGNIWLTLSGGANDVARVTPAGVVIEFDVANVSNPVGIAAGPDGNLWVTQSGGVASFAPADPTNATATPIASLADPRAITPGPDGNLWTASGDQVYEVPPANPAGFQHFAVTGMGARGISAGPSLIWIADFGGKRIVSMKTDGSVAKAYTASGGPQEVTAGPGQQVAFGDPTATPQQIGRINPPNNPLTRNLPSMTDPFGVTFGADGAYWFAQFAVNTLGRLTPSGAYTTLTGLPAASGPRYLTTGPNNTLWVGLQTSHQVARVTGVSKPPPKKAPETTITKATKRVRAGKHGAKASFRFTATPTAGASFECALRRHHKRKGSEKKLAKFTSCASPAKYRKLRRGSWTFSVRATANGLTDASPATAELKIKPRRRH